MNNTTGKPSVPDAWVKTARDCGEKITEISLSIRTPGGSWESPAALASGLSVVDGQAEDPALLLDRLWNDLLAMLASEFPIASTKMVIFRRDGRKKNLDILAELIGPTIDCSSGEPRKIAASGSTPETEHFRALSAAYKSTVDSNAKLAGLAPALFEKAMGIFENAAVQLERAAQFNLEFLRFQAEQEERKAEQEYRAERVAKAMDMVPGALQMFGDDISRLLQTLNSRMSEPGDGPVGPGAPQGGSDTGQEASDEPAPPPEPEPQAPVA